jgi:UTP--glucose-1-phosphate uridylyltransferase
MVKPIHKAIFPVAGRGTRFLPATKILAKEMLPIVDKPLIQYAVEEARNAGIEEFFFVTGRGKVALVDHFDHAIELEQALLERGDKKALQSVLPPSGRVFATRQQEPLGLGHAVLCAQKFVGEEAFAVLLADDLILAEPGCLKQMIDVYKEVGGNVVACENVPRERTCHYGILDIAEDDGRLARARGLVEKPDPAEAPSTLSIIGRYILQPEIFRHLEKWAPATKSSLPIPWPRQSAGFPSTACASKGNVSIAAVSWDFWKPTWPLRWSAKTWGRGFMKC